MGLYSKPMRQRKRREYPYAGLTPKKPHPPKMKGDVGTMKGAEALDYQIRLLYGWTSDKLPY